MRIPLPELALLSVLGCGAALTARDTTDLAAYETEQDACIVATPHDRAAIDVCRAKVKAYWCSRHVGVCQ